MGKIYRLNFKKIRDRFFSIGMNVRLSHSDISLCNQIHIQTSIWPTNIIFNIFAQCCSSFQHSLNKRKKNLKFSYPMNFSLGFINLFICFFVIWNYFIYTRDRERARESKIVMWKIGFIKFTKKAFPVTGNLLNKKNIFWDLFRK